MRLGEWSISQWMSNDFAANHTVCFAALISTLHKASSRDR